MLLTRLGLRADDYFSPDEFVHVYEFNTTPTINALGIAASDIAEMGLREISRTVMQAQRDQFLQTVEKSGYDDRTEQREIPLKGANSMEVTYRMQNGYQVPNLLMPQTPEVHLGKYAELRRQYLMKHRRVLYTNLKTSGKLTEHLAEIEQTARKMVEQTVARMAQAEGVTEELKATDPPALDGPDEQSPAQRGGTGADRPDLRLTTEEPTEAGSDELPAFVDHSGIMCCWTVCAPTVTTSSAPVAGVKSICGQAMSTRRSKKAGAV